MGMNGAMFQMIAHGISSAGMFFLVGVIYDRVHHRNLDQFGGLFARMPVYSGLAIGIFFAGLGLPGLCGFIGEVLRRARRVELQQGAGRRRGLGGDPHGRLHPLDDPAGVPRAGIQGPARRGTCTPMTRREVAIAAPLLALAILFGVYPQAIFDYMTPSVDRDGRRPGRLDRATAKQPRLQAEARAAAPQRTAARQSTRCDSPIQLAMQADQRHADEKQPDRELSDLIDNLLVRHAGQLAAGFPAGAGAVRHDRADAAAADVRG